MKVHQIGFLIRRSPSRKKLELTVSEPSTDYKVSEANMARTKKGRGANNPNNQRLRGRQPTPPPAAPPTPAAILAEAIRAAEDRVARAILADQEASAAASEARKEKAAAVAELKKLKPVNTYLFLEAGIFSTILNMFFDFN